jgi:tRNA (guanine9-N1)-methyltransferase
LKWVETRNWEESFWAVIPKRKFQGAAKDGSMMPGQGDEGGHGGETDDEETEPRIEGSDVSGEEVFEGK